MTDYGERENQLNRAMDEAKSAQDSTAYNDLSVELQNVQAERQQYEYTQQSITDAQEREKRLQNEYEADLERRNQDRISYQQQISSEIPLTAMSDTPADLPTEPPNRVPGQEPPRAKPVFVAYVWIIAVAVVALLRGQVSTLGDQSAYGLMAGVLAAAILLSFRRTRGIGSAISTGVILYGGYAYLSRAVPMESFKPTASKSEIDRSLSGCLARAGNNQTERWSCFNVANSQWKTAIARDQAEIKQTLKGQPIKLHAFSKEERAWKQGESQDLAKFAKSTKASKMAIADETVNLLRSHHEALTSAYLAPHK